MLNSAFWPSAVVHWQIGAAPGPLVRACSHLLGMLLLYMQDACAWQLPAGCGGAALAPGLMSCTCPHVALLPLVAQVVCSSMPLTQALRCWQRGGVRSRGCGAGGPRWTTPQARPDAQRRDAAPKLIPRILHQTHGSAALPPGVRPLLHSWRWHNADWEVRFYDDEACLRFVAREFPEYLDAFRALPRDVERSHFFRRAAAAWCLSSIALSGCVKGVERGDSSEKPGTKAIVWAAFCTGPSG